ncbi:MAG: hypothetical protein IPM48_02065 [Saprospiraceae bacterium]|nr:hypothetical protein [Saprospiraceae bacterium]
MRTNILLISFILYFFNFSCIETGPDDPNPPIPKDSCIVYEPILDSISKVRVYTVKDTIADFGYATKVNIYTFFNLGILRNYNRILVTLFSNDQFGDLTDLLVFYVNDINTGCYNITLDGNDLNSSNLQVGALFNFNDRDILVDNYLLDTNQVNNKIEIVSIDTAQKIIEGRFACSFVFANDRPKRDPYNLDTMRFFNGYFKGKYEDR